MDIKPMKATLILRSGECPSMKQVSICSDCTVHINVPSASFPV